ncbi:MAG: hypothetical protein AVO33_04515 [delta proteobacterium ML8_F1]|nr:MAG: hypothetical protein AVO33_04515 [delta proteobacterium ML8_F1]
MGYFGAVQGIFSLVILIVIGFWLTRIKWFDEGTSEMFAKLVINITIPAMMLQSMSVYFDIEEIRHLGMGVLAIFAGIITTYVLAHGVAVVIKVPRDERGVFSSMFALSNTIFMGLPVNIAIFGEVSIPYALTYFIANTAVFWTIGVYGIRRDTDPAQRFSLDSVKKLITPPLVGFVFAILVVVMEIRIPRIIEDTTRMLGGLTTPISAFYIGMVFYALSRRKIAINYKILVASFGKIVISPLVVFFFVSFTSLSPLMKNVFIIQASMPMMTQLVIVSRAYGARDEMVALGALVTTGLSLLTIPVYMLLFNM